MTSPPADGVSDSERVLADTTAGPKAIRGGAVRVVGYASAWR